MQKVVDLAVASIAGCDLAGIVLLNADSVCTLAHSETFVLEVDALQEQVGRGPALDVIASGGTSYAEDLGGDDRWGRFGAEAAARGVRSLLATSISLDGMRGALNLYGRDPAAFGSADRVKGVMLAALGGLAIGRARGHEDEQRRVDNLHAALATRAIIGQAQGILMEREGVTADQAFEILRQASQHLNRKLRDVAQDLVDTGERPSSGPS